ncbi:thromboxane-A synthase [Mugil cephalus]|uniref:thromboxane-A synthase n=1 Tax=Mugil cephalus TaxID=48193 RepID=UPI001FB83C5A|nr:thromboxane-A synthase [Mugil cephalus]XP_047453040.1 thromboxane-A synthase [Mugil cephalus]XP_047453041.1 thromboxane-A synthase [Mugil cephalus]
MESVADFLSVFNVEVSGFSVTLSLLLIFLGLLYWYSVYPYSVLSRYGIKHPKPSPFFGNLFMFREGFFKPLNNIINEHGRVCGYYLGRRPIVVIADPDMLKQVMVKDFNNFPNRMAFRFASKPMSDSLLMIRNEQWKRVRSILTPTFSAAKMKEMVPLINTAIDALMNNLNVHAESGEAFDIHKCFGCFTMDVIASVAFGTQVDSQNDPDDPFVRHAKMFFAATFFRPLLMFFIVFPFLATFLVGILPNKRQKVMSHFFNSTIKDIIKKREEQPSEQRRRDFLQLMLNARTSKECVSLEQFDTANHDDEADHKTQPTQPSTSDQDDSHPRTQEPSARGSQKKMITEDEIVGQAFVFLVAGYETSSNTLGFACYLLALHPECQRKVQEEVDDFFTKYDTPNYSNVQELKYLDMVISEALRLYPPGFRFAREVYHDCEVNGLFLPKGMTVEIPASFLHYDPEYWSEPEKFIPERFTPEAKAARHPYVYLPFGAGPRNCVGMRLAQLEMRMALVHLFHRFNVVACSETKVPIELNSTSTLGPKNGIFVKLTKRDV